MSRRTQRLGAWGMWRPEVECVDTAAAAVSQTLLVVDDRKTLSREILAAPKRTPKLASYFQQVLSPPPSSPKVFTQAW